jgi:hypothetical protein
VREEEHHVLIAKCKEGCSLLETTVARLVLDCAQKCRIIDWGRMVGLSASSPIREHVVGQIETRVQGISVIDKTETDAEFELEHINSDYNLLSRPQLLKLAYELRGLVQKQQVRLDDVEALKMRDVYESFHQQNSEFNYESDELAKSMLHDM